MLAGKVELAGRVAVVTGGAGGIGSAICHALAREGASVVVGYHRSGEQAEALVGTLGGAGSHRALPAAVTDSAGLGQLARELEHHYGRCDLLINCAGTTRFVPHANLDALDDELINEILATNVRGPFATVRALLGLLAKSTDALVINVSSIAAATGMGSNVMYCASKAALDNMTKSLARALAPAIRVLSISPGLVDTPFIGGLDPAWRDEQLARSPLGRLVRPDEVAAAVIAAYATLTCSTGTVIAIDGGRPLV
jgi:3-oxoacyl-[acyl-carrier protein] reductase